MKKFTFASALFILMSFSLFSQHIYTERSSGNMENVFYKRHLDNTDYMQVVNEEGYKTYIKNRESTVQTPNAQNVTLTINLEFDPAQFEAPWIIMIYDEFGFSDVAFPETNIIVIDVPEGIYDLAGTFFNFSSGQDHIIILEQQDIQGNTTLTMDVSDATNYVSYNPLDENGEILNPGLINPITNIPSLVFMERLVILETENGNASFGANYSLGSSFEGEPIYNYYINDISSRYDIIGSLVGVEFPNGDYFMKFETLSGINESVELENNLDDWIFHTESFQPSLLGENSYYGFETAITYKGKVEGALIVANGNREVDPLEGFKGFLNNPINDNPADLLIAPAIVDYVTILDPMWGEEFFFLRGNSILTNEDGDVFYGSEDVVRIGLTNTPYYLNMEKETVILPFHPKFSFLKNENPNIIQGDNVPIFISAPLNIPYFMINQMKGKYQGRYGENRETDNFAADVEVKHNGNVIFSDTFVEFLGTQLPNSGEIELILANANTVVDGLEGSNNTTIKYTADAEDYLPPTIQHLQFRNSQDQVTHVFNTAEEGHIRLAGGDFEYLMIDEWNGYFDYNEGSTVALSYSLYGENEWTELELTEYPEHFHMPAFGDYYEASLESVVVPAQNSWFDIKVLLTDAAGNSQEQIISPAFKVMESTVGIEDYDSFQFTAYPNPTKEIITLKASKNIEKVEVYNMVGKKLLSSNPNVETTQLHLASLASGVYLMKVQIDQNVKTYKIVKK